MKIQRDIYQRHVRSVPPGTVVFQEGQVGSEMYVVIDGEVEISKRTSSSAQKTLITLKKGDIFGEMSLIERKSRSATATAVTQTRLLVLNEHLFFAMIDRNPDFAAKMIRVLSERLRRANSLIQQAIGSNRNKQVYTGLAEYAGRHGSSTHKGYRVNISAFSDWANTHLGIPREEVRPIVQTFIQRGHVGQSSASEDDIIVAKRTAEVRR